jgi:hypothetical protein
MVMSLILLAPGMGSRNPFFESFQKEPLKKHKTLTAFNNQKLSLGN